MKFCCNTKPFLIGAIFWLLIGLRPWLHAVGFYSSADTSYNTTEPTGTLADSGWQWVGTWGGFQGTPISAHHFITANHVGGAVGESFTLHSVTYTTVRSFVDPASDLRIWEVRETFPSWAPLYRTNNEVGRSLIVFGRGVTRGSEVRTTLAVTGVPADSLAGWQWAGRDGKLRWGQNTVAGTFTHASYGEQLAATFDQSGGSNECHLGIGDSSGPVFINDGSAWKLAGVAGLVDGGFSTTSGGAGFNAFIFDKRGLFVKGAGPKTGDLALPSAFYATRVSSRTAWIDGILATPLTATVTLGNLSQTYDGSPRAISVTTTPANLAVSITYDGASAAPINVGSYIALATVTSFGYTGSATGTLYVAKANQSISFAALATLSMGDPEFTLNATASSGLSVEYTSSNPAVATVSGSTVTIVGPGTAILTADQAGNNNYYGAPSVSQTLTVNATQTISDSRDVPLSNPLVVTVSALLFFATGSSRLQKWTRSSAKL